MSIIRLNINTHKLLGAGERMVDPNVNPLNGHVGASKNGRAFDQPIRIRPTSLAVKALGMSKMFSPVRFWILQADPGPNGGTSEA